MTAVLVLLVLALAAALQPGGPVLRRLTPPASGGVPTGVAPDGVGDVEHLQPALRSALERAVAAAAAEGVEVRVTSGWRSAAHQQELYEQALRRYGSAARARQWVLPPDESEHVRGGAVDIGPSSGAAWLEEHGERYGLCRRYDNEPWHFERLAGAVGSRCPVREPHA